MPKSIDSIIQKAKDDKIANERRKDSLLWFKQKVETMMRPVKPVDLLTEKDRLKERLEYGKVYNFLYDPKTKLELPYYDRFPLCIPFKPLPGGFLGLNLHYLYPRYRALLLEKLADFERTDVKGELRYKFTYELLNSSAKYKWFKPCVKRYLYGHVKSKFVKIKQSEWNIVIYLPTEMFMKEKKMTVWEDTKRQFKGRI